MATADYEAIFTAIEEVCLGAIGDIRVVESGAFELGAYDAASAAKARADALLTPRIEVEYAGGERTKVVAPVVASIGVNRLDLIVRCSFTTEFELDDEGRRRTRARCATAVDEVRRALTWPGNLAETAAGVPTRLVSRCIHRLEAVKVDTKDFPGRLYAVSFGAHALIQESQPVG